MLTDYLRENSWTYQQTVQEGVEQGLEKARALTRQKIEAFIQKHFPSLLTPVKKQMKDITDFDMLLEIFSTVRSARTAKEVKNFFLTLQGF